MNQHTYLVEFADYITGAEDLPSLVKTIKECGTEGDYLDIYVQQGDPEGTSGTITVGGTIGHTQCYYMQDGIFLQCIEDDGAGVDLHKKLNELAQQPA